MFSSCLSHIWTWLEAPQTSPIGNPAVAVHEVRKLAAGPHPASQQYQQQLYHQQHQQQQQLQLQQLQQLQQQHQYQQQQYQAGPQPSPSQTSLPQSPPGSQCSPQLTQLQACARQALQAGQVCTPRRLGRAAQRAAQLRSPVVKRPVGAPVAQQGWLHKQGSEGLMLWKKRWFVLCDYCLFYYKGPEEEKLLGSILLPSYTISPCTPQVDRVYRKFSFKAEHANMRTYYFAADTHEVMLQWMHCMSLASVLQDRPSYEEPGVITQQPTHAQHSPGDESDAGFGTYRPRLAVSSGSMNGWQSPLLQQQQQTQQQQQAQQQQQQNAFDDRSYHHHLYANAPPKPRRLANEDMGSSSDQSPEHHQSMTAQPQQPPRMMQANYQYAPGAASQVQSRLVMSPNNAERRTPDTYSRPAGSMQPNVINKIKPGDYEDVYNSERRQMENQTWARKFGQPAYLQTSGSSAKIITKGYEATYNNRGEEKQQPLNSVLGQAPRGKQPPRPHSADFLDYDARRHEEVIDIAKSPEPQIRGARSQFSMQPPRPKSSLDIMRDPDNLYWSEEGYAQKMRQSAYLLQQTPGTALPNPQVPTRSNFPSFSNMLQSQSSSRVSELAANRVLSPSAELMRESEQQHILNMQRRQEQLLEEQKILQQELEYQKQQSQEEQMQRQQIEEEEERQLMSYYSEMQTPMSQQPFMRSASARLPRHRYDPEREDEEEGFKPRRNSGSGSGLYAQRRPGSEYGSQKFQQYTAVSTTPDMSTPSSLEATTPREESMKRLLEWKQRMLQSPLARKPSGSATRGVNSAQNQLSNYYKQQALRELADQERRAQGLALSRHLSQDALVDVPYMSNSKLLEMQDLVDDQAGSVPWSTEMLDSQETADFLALKSQEDAAKMSRSRSQEGRRSSASNRYTSYSSDEDMSLSLSGAGSSRDFMQSQSQLQLQLQMQGLGLGQSMDGLSNPAAAAAAGPTAPGAPGAPNGARDRDATRALSSLSARINSLDREITALSRSQTMELSTPESLASPDSSTSPPSPGDFLELIRPRTWESLEVQEARAKEALEFREAYQAHKVSKVSAGELLGRTHEELVLLLIQLRRASAAVCKAMESCHMEIETQARLAELDTPKQIEHLQRLEDLKKQLVELEKQHEKGKPLVNLVDNMVKLGSLYRNGTPTSGSGLGSGSSSMHTLSGIPSRERLEFNYKVQEQRLLAEERRDWDRLSPDYGQLQAKVQQLYRLDQEMQEESHTLQTLQVDKELVERALTGVRLKLATAQIPPNLRDTYRKQQRLLERELSRVRLLLAHNSKKLEETVAENARLEQELVILRQKLQTSRQESFSSPSLGLVDTDYPLTPEESPHSTAHLEAELKRVQLIMGDLHRQRHEISVAVKQLTERSDPVRPGPTGVAGAGPIPGKKKQQSSWVETDLDSLVSKETGNMSQPTSPVSSSGGTPLTSSTIPLYVNTETEQAEKPQADTNGIVGEPQTLLTSSEPGTIGLSQIELSEADDRMKRFYGIIPKEKQQEFKTVRIVKRESERRQRDRDRSGNIGIPLFAPTGKRVSLPEDQNDNSVSILDRSQQPGLGQLLETEEASVSAGTNVSNHMGPTTVVTSSDSMMSTSFLGSEPSSMSLATTSTTTTSSWAQETDSSQALDEAMAQLDDELEMTADAVFQRSLSLPRGFGKTNAQGIEVEAAPTLDSKYNLRMKKPLVASAPGSESNLSMAGIRRQRVRFDTHSGSGSESNTSSPSGSRPLSAREQLFGSAADEHLMTGYSMLGLASRETSPQLSPVFSNHAAYQSEAARQIVMEMNAGSPSVLPPQRVVQQKALKQQRHLPQQQQQQQQQQSPQRRVVPREKRRHHTVSGRPLSEVSSSPLPVLGARSRDDLDMERALRTRHNAAPDVVRSTLSRRAPKYDADTIDSILGTPGKIHIPERYVPENEPALSQEERLQRLRKADAIRKMLSETRSTTTLPSTSGEEEPPTSTLKKKAEEEKKQHEHLLQLNQLLAKQVMEKSKIVAEKALSQRPPEDEDKSTSDDESPEHPLPLYQQRENFYS